MNRFLSWGTRSVQESEAHLREIIEAQRTRPRKRYYLAVELTASRGKTIGGTGFSWTSPEAAEIGYFLEPAYWGQGYATEAARIIAGLAFELGAELVVASCDARNTASEDVMKRLGMNAMTSDDSARLTYAIGRSGHIGPC